MKNKHGQELAKKRWANTSPEDRKAHSEKMIDARVKKLGQKRHKVTEQNNTVV